MQLLKCPSCGSYKTLTNKQYTLGAGAGLLLFGFLGSFLVFPLVLVPIGFIILLVGAMKKPTTGMCRTCKYQWTL